MPMQTAFPPDPCNTVNEIGPYGRPMKRKRTTSEKSSASGIAIRQILRQKDGVKWTPHIVQG